VRRKYRRAFDSVDGPTHAAPQLKMQRALAGPDFEHALAWRDADAIKQRMRNRIP
jgi:hypothetical protein